RTDDIGNIIGVSLEGGASNSLEGGASNNTVGGTLDGESNTIAFHVMLGGRGGNGVVVDTGDGNAILRNSTFGNAGLGILLVNGGNNNQAAPVLQSALLTGGGVRVLGMLTSTPGMRYRIEFFANDRAGSPTVRDARTFLGATD